MNRIDDYIINYRLYMEQVSLGQREMNRYIQECICLEQNNYAGLEFLNEGVFDSVKEFMEKVIEKVKQFFAKLMDSFKKTFSTDQSYLSDNKDIILQREVTIEFTDYYEYDIKLFTEESAIPKFAYDEMHKGNYLESEDTFIAKYFPKFVNKGKSFYDNVIYLLQGKEPVGTKEGKTINMKDLYNYCYEYKQLVEKLEKELNELVNAKAEAIKITSEKATEVAKPPSDGKKEEEKNVDSNKEEEKNKEETSDTTNKKDKPSPKPAIKASHDRYGNPIDSQEQKTDHSSVYYSSVYGQPIMEEFIHELSTSGKSSSTSSSSSSSSPTKPSDAESVVKNQKTSYGRKDSDLGETMKGTDVEKLKKEINVYFGTCTSMLSAKIEIAKRMYTDYMFVIRQHIRSVIGTKDAKSTNKAIDTPTVFATRLNDDILSKLNQGEVEEYNKLYDTFKEIYAQYYAKNSSGTQFYRTNLKAKKGEPGYWTKSTDTTKDTAAVDEAIKNNEEHNKAYEALKTFLKDKDITENLSVEITTNNNLPTEEDKK